MSKGLEQQDRAVRCGHWPLFRYDPRRAHANEPALILDSRTPSISFGEYAAAETRYRALADEATLAAEAQRDAEARWHVYEALARSSGKPE